MFLEKAKNGNNQWYFYLFTIFVVFLAVQVASFPLAFYAILNTKGDLVSYAENLAIPQTNIALALTLFTFVVGVFALLFCIVKIHRKKWLDTLTGRKRFDVKRAIFGAIVWGILSLLLIFIQYGLGDNSHLQFQFNPGQFTGMVLVLIIFMPFQVGFEEWMFRGYLMQGSALLFQRKWAAVLATGIIFGLLHGANPEVKQFGFWLTMPQYIIMGLTLGVITVLDDGLELAFGLHFANNFLSAITVTHKASALQTHALFLDTQPQVSPWDGVIMLVCGLIFIWICHQKYHFGNKLLKFS